MNQAAAVTVDRDFARFGNKSYAINKINSVEIRQRHPHGQGAMFLWGLLCFITLMILLGQVGDPESSGLGATLFFGALFGFLAYRAWKLSKIIEYQLFLMTSSSEAQAIVSQDSGYISDLRDRIERAMAGQLVA